MPKASPRSRRSLLLTSPATSTAGDRTSQARPGRPGGITRDPGPDPALFVTPTGDLVRYNQAALRQFPDWQATQAPHPLLTQWEPIHSRLLAGTPEGMETITLGEKTYEVTFRAETQTGGAWLYAHDITGLKLAEHRLTQQLTESRTLFHISEMLSSSLELPVVVQQIADAAVTLVTKADLAVLHVLDASQSYLRAMAIAGKQTTAGRLSQPLNFKIGQGIAGTVIATQQAITLEDAPTDPRYLPDQSRSTSVRSLLVAPVAIHGQCQGTLSVQTTQARAFTPDDERLLTQLGTLAALALDKANLLKATHEKLQEEQRLRRQLVQAEKLSALGRMVASVTHELNNPLQAIQNALYLVGTDLGLSQQSRQDLEVAARETRRMAELVVRLRDTYRPTASAEFKPVVLTHLVDEVLQLLDVHFRRNTIAVTFTPPGDLPAQPLVPDQIKQVLINLCLNAVEVMPNGGTLTITLALDPDHQGTRLAVTDSGPGIAAEALPHIFDPFFTTKPGGTGLGLAISYDLATQHKGRIDVSSQLGHGSTFTLWLPCSQPPPPEPLPAAYALPSDLAPAPLAPPKPGSDGSGIFSPSQYA
jgi:two-component system, NtrC family, sensor kinase